MAFEGKPAGRVGRRLASGVHVSTVDNIDSTDTVILFCQGSGTNLWTIHSHLNQLSIHIGIPIVSFDYPGIGYSTGTASESSAYAATLEVYDDLLDQHTGRDVLVMGYSLGAAMAMHLISKRPELTRVVLVSPLCSALAWRFNTVAWFPSTLDCFETLKMTETYAHRIDKILVVHGSKDTMVPLWHSEVIYGTCAQSLFSDADLAVIEDGSHNILGARAFYELIRFHFYHEDDAGH